MPYILVRYKDGWRVCKRDDPEVCFSKKPLPKKRAKKQMMAIGISERKIGGVRSDDEIHLIYNQYVSQNKLDASKISLKQFTELYKKLREELQQSPSGKVSDIELSLLLNEYDIDNDTLDELIADISYYDIRPERTPKRKREPTPEEIPETPEEIPEETPEEIPEETQVATQKGSAKPKDMKLYNRIKKEIYDKNPKHSLYRSAMVVKEYKRQGGEYIDSLDDKKGIPKWFNENWLSANDYLRGKEVPCGANNAEKYGEYPLCYAEERLKKFSKEELRELIDKKTELGKKHLPTKEITGKGTKTEKKLYTLYPSDVRGKKWDIYWINPETDQVNKTSFGAKNMSDYTIHKDEERRERYRNRHKKDNIDEPFSPGALSWYVLWGDSTDIQKNLRDYLRRVKIVK